MSPLGDISAKKKSIMKQTKIIVTIIILFFLLNSCKKDAPTRLNVDLKTKGIDEVNQYLYGKWRVHYNKGGVIGGIDNRDGYFEFDEFTTNNRHKYYFNNALMFNDSMRIIRDTINPTVNVFYIRLMIQIQANNGLFGDLKEIDGIYNDTLFLYSPDRYNPDAVTILLTKTN